MKEKIICKLCNKTVLAVYDSEVELNDIDSEILDIVRNTPCSKCVPVEGFIKQLEKERLI